MKKAAVLALVLLAPLAAVAGKKKLPLPAPLPSEVSQAKTAFLTNAGGSELAFDAFYRNSSSGENTRS